MNGVMIGDKHSYRDFGIILSSKVISPPEVQRNEIEIPLRDGSIDLTESLTGSVKFKDRLITMGFSVIDPVKNWSAKVSEIENYLHGKKLDIIFDDDPAFYYTGRVSVSEWTSEGNIGSLVFECIAEPYKYDRLSSADNWEWDDFDFETGIINEASGLAVSGELAYTLICRRKSTVPEITVDTAMTVSFRDKTYQLRAGTQKIYDILLQEGENVLVFQGEGVVTINYRGGSL